MVPPAVKRQLKRDAWANSIRTAILLEYQQKLDERLTRAGVPVIWLKGLSLSERLYGCPEARCSGDLDLLIERATDDAVSACLRELGFAPVFAGGLADAEHPLAEHHRTWKTDVGDGPTVTVEVHHAWSGPPRQPAVADLFARSRQAALAGRPMRILGLEDEFLFLCFHAYHHHFVLLRCLTDIADFTDLFAGEIDWRLLAATAKQCGAVGIVAATLALTERMLEVAWARENLARWAKLDGRRRWAIQSLSPLSLLDYTLRTDDLLEARLTMLLDYWPDIARSWVRRVWPSSAYVARDCPDWVRGWPGLPRAWYYGKVLKNKLSPQQ